MRARYYNIDIKRFINQDVILGNIDSSASLNRYAYVEGNPVSYLDPFGLDRSESEKIHDLISKAQIVLSIMATAILLFTGGTQFAFALSLCQLANDILFINQIAWYLSDIQHAEAYPEVVEALIGIFNCVVGYGLGKVLGTSNVNEVLNTSAGKGLLELEYSIVNYVAGKIAEVK